MLEKKISTAIGRYFPLFIGWSRYILYKHPDWLLRKDILKYYDSVSPSEINEEQAEAVSYIRKKGAHYFPYSFIEKYNPEKIKVYTNEKCGLKYVLHNEKRLYFARETSAFNIQRIYTNLLYEQDCKSAHCYQTETFRIEEEDILLDVGAAEGIFSLTVIEKVKKVYLFEVEERWLEALRETFKPWQDKVEIICKYVSDTDSEQTAKLDTVIKKLSNESLFLKLDVEGAEKLVIKGAYEILTSGNNKIKAAVCTYHNQDDHEELSAIMKDLGYRVSTSPGYMLFKQQNLAPPYLRRGLIYCSKE